MPRRAPPAWAARRERDAAPPDKQSTRPEQSIRRPAGRAAPLSPSQAALHFAVEVGLNIPQAAALPPESREVCSQAVSIARWRKILRVRSASNTRTSRIDFQNCLRRRPPVFVHPTTVQPTTSELAERQPQSQRPSTEPGPVAPPAGNTRSARYGDKDSSRSVPDSARR